jgi:hypothetical protein
MGYCIQPLKLATLPCSFKIKEFAENLYKE